MEIEYHTWQSHNETPATAMLKRIIYYITVYLGCLKAVVT